MNPRVWLVTGASSGFGRAITESALQSGDIVVGAARRPHALDDLAAQYGERLLGLQFDVTDTSAVGDVLEEVEERYGRLDVLVNNAGRGQLGAAEATSDAELRDLFELHFFGPVALIRAVLPIMRMQRSGAIVQMSSFGGQVAPAGFSAYCATKFALEGYSEALAHELRPYGVRVLIVEPGNFRTSLLGGSMLTSTVMPEYEETVGPTRNMTRQMDGRQPGDPAKAAAAIRAALAADEPPLRLPLGEDALEGILDHLSGVAEEIRAWAPLARDTAFD